MRFEKSEAEKYIESVFVKEIPERINILEDLSLNNKHGIQVSPTEGQLLKFLVQMIGAQKIVEIGTLFGYSTSWFLEGLKDVSTKRNYKVWSLEKEELHYKMATHHLESHIQNEHLEILMGDALVSLQSIEQHGPFDLIFIDANKSGYMDYFHWADKNLRKGGLIIADNTFLFGQVFSEQEPENNKKAWRVMRELNQTLATHPNYTSALFPTPEGMTLAFKTQHIYMEF